MQNPKEIVKSRPAESAGVAGYIALLIGRAGGIDDPETLLALAGVVAFLPSAVTWIVNLVRGR